MCSSCKILSFLFCSPVQDLKMGFSVHWSWLAALSCLLCMGGEVRCDCTEAKMEIEGGHYVLTRQLRTGSRLIYQCPEGYYPYPAMTRLCQPNGSWKPAPKGFAPQRCRLVECPDPTVLEHGYVSPPQERYFVNNETTYECYSGHTMRGSSSRVCLPNGKWSGSTPICSYNSEYCADPGIPPGASRTRISFGIGDAVQYSCNDNLYLIGSSERVCQENGEWTGKEPACYYKHTYDTPLEVSQVFGSTLKERLTTLEQTDETQVEKKIRISKNGLLNIYIAIDISQHMGEEHINNSKDFVKKLIEKISSFAVTPNYEILFFSCDVFEVVNILDFWQGKISPSTIMSELENFKVEDRDTIETDLNLVFKTFLQRMALIKQVVGREAFKEHRHILTVLTNGAYSMSEPAPTVAKIKNLVYMGQTNEGGIPSREEYLDIYVFAIGREIFDEDLQRLTVGTGGNHYFRLKDIRNLQQAIDEIIDEEEVMGLCGLHVEHGTSSFDGSRKMYPWLAIVHIQNEGMRMRCMGSLVSPQFVLTAAQCLPFGVLPDHITVEIDDGQSRVKTVQTFYVHPNYNIKSKVAYGVMEFYDYDVALLQLKTNVQISRIARPICIPCTQETSYALKLFGNSTCKEQEQLLLKNHLERLNFLTKSVNMVQQKVVHAKLGHHRDECISHALNAEGITTNNPKDAVTDNFLCTGGLTPFRDHIACPGDSGAAVFKDYGHRTVQVAVLSWGTKSLCRSGGIVESDDTSRDFHINLFRVVPFLKSILGNDHQDEFAPLIFLEV